MFSEIVANPGKSGRQFRTGHSSARQIVQLLVPEQHLDQADVDLLLQQVGISR